MDPPISNEAAHWRPSTGHPGSRHVGAFTELPGLIRELGGDPGAILLAAGVDPAVLDRPTHRISNEDLVRLLSIAAERTRSPHFGLAAGRLWHITDLGPLCELMRHSPTVGNALMQGVVHQHLNSEGALAFLVNRGATVDFGYAIYVPFEDSVAHLYSTGLAAYMNFMRDLCGESWRPAEVLFSQAPPADDTPFRQCFGAPLRFNAGFNALRFPATWLAQPIAGADPVQLRLVRAQIAARDRQHLDDSVHRAVRKLLLHGRTSGVDVAQSLALHRRTLNRRLAHEGTTYQKVLDRVRLAVAKELLEDTRLSQPAIAAVLGYRDEVSFLRAFRRWTGSTPGAWRRGLRARSIWPRVVTPCGRCDT